MIPHRVIVLLFCGIIGRSAVAFDTWRGRRLASAPPPVIAISPGATHSCPSSSSLKMANDEDKDTYETVIGKIPNYEVTVIKPLGVIFGENPEPYLGLVVDDVSEGLNGGRAGLRTGDQLVAVDGRIVVGKDFDTAMGLLRDAEGTVSLTLFRGPVMQLFDILRNQVGGVGTLLDEDDDEGEVIVMDESYESPLVVEVKEEKPLTAGDFMRGLGKLASMAGEALTSVPEQGASNGTPASKKNNGFFGIGAETVQLDGEDAQGYRQEGGRTKRG